MGSSACPKFEASPPVSPARAGIGTAFRIRNPGTFNSFRIGNGVNVPGFHALKPIVSEPAGARAGEIGSAARCGRASHALVRSEEVDQSDEENEYRPCTPAKYPPQKKGGLFIGITHAPKNLPTRDPTDAPSEQPDQTCKESAEFGSCQSARKSSENAHNKRPTDPSKATSSCRPCVINIRIVSWRSIEAWTKSALVAVECSDILETGSDGQRLD